MSLKSDIIYVFSHYFANLKFDSYDSLPTEKIFTLHNVIILIKSVLNKKKVTTTIRCFQKNAHINQVKHNHKKMFFYSIIMEKSGRTEIKKEKLDAVKKNFKTWDVWIFRQIYKTISFDNA